MFDENFFLEVLKCESTADNREGRKKAIGVVEEYLKRSNIPYEKGDEPEPWILAGSGRWEPEYGALCHIDVVREFYLPKKEGDKIVGRGTLDMKGALCASICALRGSQNASVLITSDEEVGGKTAATLAQRYIPKKSLLVPDSGENFTIITAEKGILHFGFRVSGRATHGSRPWDGENSIEKAFEIYKKLKKELKANNEKGWHNTLSLNILNAGSGVNVVPDSAVVKLDFRFTEGNIEDWKAKIASVVGEFDVISQGNCTGTDRDDPELKRFTKEVKRQVGKVKFDKANGATDMRFFSRIKSKILIYPEGNGIHGKEEWVSLSSLEKLTKIISNYWETKE
ncbi:M20/M25/M40 family metallo-hydrolase [Candidatus Micrarchaeota archaeon]|nr:M20/M25/M40 family metallo-hydrolase [Candidatus Micrarchaeota archaeon]